jgi:site-specific recombinase XerD
MSSASVAREQPISLHHGGTGPYSTRRRRQLVAQDARAAGIETRVYPHLFRHQLITPLTKHGIISPKL